MAYKDSEKKGTALQKNVASLQQELQDAKKAAEHARSSLCGKASQLNDSLDKARAELRELALERDALIDKAQGLTEKRVHILRVNARVYSLGKVPTSLMFEKFG
jgi:chromosome segregation ATPase